MGIMQQCITVAAARCSMECASRWLHGMVAAWLQCDSSSTV